MPSAIEALGSSSEWMPSRWAVLTTLAGPTVTASFAAMVFSELESARVSVTGP